ncbi:MAG TPA: RNA polymerase sigma-70 factor [Dysgonomonas sp.]|nr:RNA polymerase sigma-70 factor [Dysgonomonas sp.]
MHDKKQIFNSLYKEFYRRCFLFAKSFVHKDEIAEEIASDALISMWEKMQQEEIISPKDFLFRIIKNKSLDYLKHQSLHMKLFESIDSWELQDISIRISSLEKSTSQEILSAELNEIIRKSIESLPKRTRQVFVMSRFEYLSGKDISSILGISTKGVEYHISKALKILSVKLKDYLTFLFLSL